MITLKNVTKEYNKGNIGLEDVSLDIAKGEFVFIVGKSGIREDNPDEAFTERT